jgi:maleylacetate reductase
VPTEPQSSRDSRPSEFRSFTWVDGERLIRFGAGALEEAPGLLASRGFTEYALLTTERAAESAPALSDGAATVLHVPAGPVPEAAAAILDQVGEQPLVALGGGRVVDSAKAIAGAEGLSVAAVPTTLSGAEMTQFHRMPAGVEIGWMKRPALVIASPALMASQPMPGLAASAMNALAHAIEALYTPLANPVADDVALRAVELIGQGLAPEEPRREQLALGALLAGYASGSAGFAVHHAVCQTIVRVAGTPHAQTNTVMLPHFVRMMESRAPEQIALVAAAMGAPDGAGGAASRVSEAAARAGVTRLGELGFDREVISDVVGEALQHPALANTPKPPDEAELTRVVEAAL